MPTKHEIRPDAQGLPADLLLDVVNVFKALSDPTRAQLIYLLTQQEHSVNELSDRVSVSSSAVSHHLAKLRDRRLVNSRRDGNQIYYSIDDSHVAALFTEALYHLDHIHHNLPNHPYQTFVENLSKNP